MARARQALDERLRERPEDSALLDREARWLLISRRPAEALEVSRRGLALQPQSATGRAMEG